LASANLKELVMTVIIPVLDYISLCIRLLGVVFILLGAVRIFAKAILVEVSKDTERKTTKDREKLRRQLSSYMLFGLELLIAGDIIRTVLDPTLEEIAVLGSIVAVRTVISFFLNRELEKSDGNKKT